MPYFAFSVLKQVLLFTFCRISVEVFGVIHGKYSENIEFYHLAVPHKATPEGEFSSFHLPHFHEYDSKQFMKRKKRELEDPDAVHYGIMVDNELQHVELWPHRDFVHPQAIVEKRDPTIPVHLRDVRGINKKKMCYYIGRVRGKDNSRAAISTCDGLAGYIQFGNKMYFIEPVQSHSPNSKGHHLHVVYPPNIGSAENFCGVKNSAEDWERAVKNRIREEYLNGKNIFKREIFSVVSQYMESMIVCDKAMVLKHKGKRDIEEWILTIASMVKNFYADSSMTGVLQPVLVRIIYLEKEEEEMDLNIIENCDITLDNFCNWTQKLQPKDETHPNHFDVAVLLSDWDFCDSTDNCNVQGLAYPGGACSKTQNCQINEDRGMITTIIVSHEQGHLLGMLHDGVSPVICPPNDTSDNSWYVMSPIAFLKTTKWSPCSTAAMRQLAESHLLDCFNDQPANQEYELDKPAPGVVYDKAEQCRMKFRDDPNITDSCAQEPISCTQMYCVKLGSCMWYQDDWADGTSCGENKWCYQRVCEDKGSRPAAIKGGWGDWGDWSPCTKTCSRGIQFRERLCDNPKPENHGQFCLGDCKEYRICNPQECPIDAPSYRELQCRELFPKSSYVTTGMYKAEDVIGGAYNVEDPCLLGCQVTGNKVLKVSTVIGDGAKCEVGNPTKMCLSGRCVEVGCDGVFKNSKAVIDQCGICNGDGTKCKKVEGNDTTRFQGYRMIVVVPAGTRKVKIEELQPSSNLLAVGMPDNKTVLFNKDFRIMGPGTFPLGSKSRSFFFYSKIPTEVNHEDRETIIWDWTREDIGVYIGHISKRNEKTVGWSWMEPLDAPEREAKYHWEIVEYKECSAKCGGGVQEAIIDCYEEVGGKVSTTFCEKLDKPKEDTKKCNEQPCEPDWKVGEWGPCRACKKKGGVRIREVQCVKPNPKKVGDDIITEDSECKDVKPGMVQLCETRKKCRSRKRKAPYLPAKFQETIWQQMNKLHLVKRGALKSRAYLKGKAPTTTRKTTTFTWTPPSFKPGKKVFVDEVRPNDIVDATEVEMRVVVVNGSDKEQGSHTILVHGTTKRSKENKFPKRFNKTLKHKKHKSTKKP